jgi:hypothetical protein
MFLCYTICVLILLFFCESFPVFAFSLIVCSSICMLFCLYVLCLYIHLFVWSSICVCIYLYVILFVCSYISSVLLWVFSCVCMFSVCVFIYLYGTLFVRLYILWYSVCSTVCLIHLLSVPMFVYSSVNKFDYFSVPMLIYTFFCLFIYSLVICLFILCSSICLFFYPLNTCHLPCLCASLSSIPLFCSSISPFLYPSSFVPLFLCSPLICSFLFCLCFSSKDTFDR